MISASAIESQSILFSMSSGSEYRAKEVFLYQESKLRQAQALRLSAAGNMNGISTGVGFLGSPEWAIGGAVALGILEGIASNAAAKKGLAQLDQARLLLTDAKKEGAFVPACNIENITEPNPAVWRGMLSQPTPMWYAHNGDPFILIRTIDERSIHIAWEKVEAVVPPLPRQLTDEELMQRYGITLNGSLYSYCGRHYTRLADALNMASS